MPDSVSRDEDYSNRPCGDSPRQNQFEEDVPFSEEKILEEARLPQRSIYKPVDEDSLKHKEPFARKNWEPIPLGRLSLFAERFARSLFGQDYIAFGVPVIQGVFKGESYIHLRNFGDIQRTIQTFAGNRSEFYRKVNESDIIGYSPNSRVEKVLERLLREVCKADEIQLSRKPLRASATSRASEGYVWDSPKFTAEVIPFKPSAFRSLFHSLNGLVMGYPKQDRWSKITIRGKANGDREPGTGVHLPTVARKVGLVAGSAILGSVIGLQPTNVLIIGTGAVIWTGVYGVVKAHDYLLNRKFKKGLR